MPLNEIKCKNAKPSDKIQKLSDEKGMYLQVNPSGGKTWQLKYRFAGKEKKLAIGSYPETSLKEARDKRDDARKMIQGGIDPSAAKKAAKESLKLNHENSFEAIALEWHKKQTPTWTAQYEKVLKRRLEGNLFPFIGSIPVNAVTAPDLLMTLRKIEARGAIDLTHRMHQVASQILRYAIATKRADRDVSADLRGAFQTQKKKNHAYLKEEELPEFLRQLEAYEGEQQKQTALKLLLLTFVRTGELRGAKWEEINFDKAEWRIPAERMKMKELHIVPLSKQAIELFKKQQQISHNREYIFPNNHKPLGFMSENTMLYAIYRMGYHSRATGHGFRATASTILNEHGYKSDVIERQLAHGERNAVRAAYNHAQHLPERREMMQWWSDYLNRLASSS